MCGDGEGTLLLYHWGLWGDCTDRYPAHSDSVDSLLAIGDSVLCTGSSDGTVRCVCVYTWCRCDDPLPDLFATMLSHSGQFRFFPMISLVLLDTTHPDCPSTTCVWPMMASTLSLDLKTFVNFGVSTPYLLSWDLCLVVPVSQVGEPLRGSQETQMGGQKGRRERGKWNTDNYQTQKTAAPISSLICVASSITVLCQYEIWC